MTPIRAPALAAPAFKLPLKTTQPTNAFRCAACSVPLNGEGIPFKIKKSFGDAHLLSDPVGRWLCSHCDALMESKDVATATASGAVSHDGFLRLLSNEERFHFLVQPPEPPFSLAVINAKRQHVWWMARTTYDRDLILLQFGHRQLTINRPLSIEIAIDIINYEKGCRDRDKRPTFVFAPLSRDLKSPSDGETTFRFQIDKSPEAAAIKAKITQITLGDLWAIMQVRAAMRETKTCMIADCLDAYAAKIAKKKNKKN